MNQIKFEKPISYRKIGGQKNSGAKIQVVIFFTYYDIYKIKKKYLKISNFIKAQYFQTNFMLKK